MSDPQFAVTIVSLGIAALFAAKWRSVARKLDRCDELDRQRRGEWDRWVVFVNSLRRSGSTQADAVFDLVDILHDETIANLTPPLTHRTDGGVIQVAWDSGNVYVDIEVFKDGNIEWFYRNRVTGALDGTDGAVSSSPVPDALVARINELLEKP